jgi:DNA integrity scanning protein DisA with diadenylate cyclase activity
VAKAYDNARGFVESDRAYSQDYQRALLECDYMSTIKTVNQIFYKNYSVISKEKLNGIEIALKSMWVLSLVFIVMAFTFPFMSFASEDVLIVILLAVMLVVLVTVAIRTFVGRPNSNNQM